MSVDSKNLITKITGKIKKDAPKTSPTKQEEPKKTETKETTLNSSPSNGALSNENTSPSAFEKQEDNFQPLKTGDNVNNALDNIEKLLESKDVLEAFETKLEIEKESEVPFQVFDTNDTKEFFNGFQVTSTEEFKTLVEGLKLNIDIDYTKLEAGNYKKEELDEISQAVAIALETTEGSEHSSLREENIDTYRELNNKYNLGFDLNSKDSINNLSDEQKTLLEQAYITDIQEQHIEASKQTMMNYFDTLGLIDTVYDSIKDTVGMGLTKTDIEQYYEKEKLKNSFLSSVVQNGGEVSLNDPDLKQQLVDIVNNNLENYDLQELTKYAVDYFGVSKEDIDVFKQNHPELFNEGGGRYVDEYGNVAGDDEIKKAFIKEMINIDSLENIDYKQAYNLVNGVEYNQELINNIIDSQDVYSSMVQTQQSAVNFEQIIQNSSPKEALEYFEELAKKTNDGSTGEELFNKYYAEMFKDYPEKFVGQDISGAKCVGISVKDGYLWQEVSHPEGMDMRECQESEFLYKTEDGKYYKVVSLEDEHDVLSNISGKDEIYQMRNFGSKWDDPTYSNHPLALFYKANDTVVDENLYLDTVRQDFNEKYGDGAFDAILDKYPEMYQDAFGKNILTDKLSQYQGDMDTYARNLSLVMCAGCLAATCCGVVVPMPIGIISTFSDNFINGLNIDTSNLSKSEKQALRKQLLAETFVEGGIFLLGTAANETIQNIDLDFIMKYKSALGASSEYLIESGSDTADLFKNATYLIN